LSTSKQEIKSGDVMDSTEVRNLVVTPTNQTPTFKSNQSFGPGTNKQTNSQSDFSVNAPKPIISGKKKRPQTAKVSFTKSAAGVEPDLPSQRYNDQQIALKNNAQPSRQIKRPSLANIRPSSADHHSSGHFNPQLTGK
jgi:hypothetical protein